MLIDKHNSRLICIVWRFNANVDHTTSHQWSYSPLHIYTRLYRGDLAFSYIGCAGLTAVSTVMAPRCRIRRCQFLFNVDHTYITSMIIFTALYTRLYRRYLTFSYMCNCYDTNRVYSKMSISILLSSSLLRKML